MISTSAFMSLEATFYSAGEPKRLREQRAENSKRELRSLILRPGEEVTCTLLTYSRNFWESPEILIDLVRQVVKEFVLSGGVRPACIEWPEEPY
ncbi:Imm1 family immunity protein [Streptomyces sp. NPDC002176]|uniref:Imm1 family immunity protein n=1 Tax=Streptomyces sp. NPDC002176 TaxID=3364634 RepID=UPI00384C2833